MGRKHQLAADSRRWRQQNVETQVRRQSIRTRGNRCQDGRQQTIGMCQEYEYRSRDPPTYTCLIMRSAAHSKTILCCNKNNNIVNIITIPLYLYDERDFEIGTIENIRQSHRMRRTTFIII